MITAALDPGLRAAGLAIFRYQTLAVGTLVRSPLDKIRDGEAWAAMGRAVAVELSGWTIDHFVAEIPQVYRGFKADPDDLIQLAGVVGAVAHVVGAPRVTCYRPRQWKKSVPKDVFCARIESRLSLEEVSRIRACPASLRHNVIDAVGLGLVALGRL